MCSYSFLIDLLRFDARVVTGEAAISGVLPGEGRGVFTLRMTVLISSPSFEDGELYWEVSEGVSGAEEGSE